MVANNIISGKKDSYNIWDTQAALREPVGFELFPLLHEDPRMVFKLSYKGSSEIVSLGDRNYPVVWQIRPVWGPELRDAYKMRVMQFGPSEKEVVFYTHKWVIGNVCGETTHMRRDGRPAPEQVMTDITFHML